MEDYEKYLEKERKNLEKTKLEQKETVNKVFDTQSDILNESYAKQIDDATAAYEDLYERNAVQKLINERKIAEKNADLGLADSGLNRVQQTAAQLSYANQKSNIDLARQDNIDKLSQNLAASLSNIEQNRLLQIGEIDAAIENQAQSNAVSRYNSDVGAETQIQKAKIDAVSSGANVYELNNAMNQINNIINKEGSQGGGKSTAADVIRIYYMSGLISPIQTQQLIEMYELEEYVTDLKEITS